MRVLLVSKFLHHVGGVETYLRWQAHALRQRGHTVGLVGMTPPAGAELMDLGDAPIWFTPTRSYEAGAQGRGKSAALSIWSPTAGTIMTRALREFRPDVVHFHGTCYQLTPAVVAATRRARIPMVLTAHEYKLLCANQTLYDDVAGAICTACSGQSALGKVTAPMSRSCMKGSRAVTLLGAVEGRVSEPTWRRADPLILAPSDFMRRQLLAEGWRDDQVRYLDLPWRPDDLSVPNVPRHEARNIVFLGRLAPVKGAETLLTAWRTLAPRYPEVRLRFLGDGADRPHLERLVESLALPRVDFLGMCGRAQIEEELGRAVVTAHPARWHENSPFSVRESLMAGVPAVVSNLGGMPEMVSERTGWVVPFDSPDAWIAALDEAISAPRTATPDFCAAVSERAMSESDHLERLDAAYLERQAASRG